MCAVAARNEDSPAAFFFGVRGGSEKVVRLVTRRLCVLKAACCDKFRDEIELLNQRIVELASTLVSGKFLMPVGGDFQRIPCDEQSQEWHRRAFGRASESSSVGHGRSDERMNRRRSPTMVGVRASLWAMRTA
jgi:hypothetical protein